MSEVTDSLPAPWRFESLDCTGAEGNAAVTTDGSTATVTVSQTGPRGEVASGVISCTYTNEQMNLVVQKTDGGVVAVAGGDPFNYTITVTNAGSVATSDPVTVTDTIGPGLEFAGTPTVPAGGSCEPPNGTNLTCTLTQPIAPGETVTIVVPARVSAGTVGPAQNLVTIDSTEDPLCPAGVCPPPPACIASPQVLGRGRDTGADGHRRRRPERQSSLRHHPGGGHARCRRGAHDGDADGGLGVEHIAVGRGPGVHRLE